LRMKRTLALAVLLLAGAVAGRLFLVRAPGPAKTKPASGQVLANRDIANILLSPRGYRDRAVRFFGRVAADPEYDSEGTHIQVYVVYGAKNTNIVVDYPATLEITQGDFIALRGRVGEPFTGVTDSGERLSTFRVDAAKVRGASAEQALAPPDVVRAGKTSRVWRDVEVSVERVEFAAAETRFYMKVDNRSAEAIVNQIFNCQASQGARLLGLQPNRIANYKELAVDLPGGSSDRGVLVFPALKPGRAIGLVLNVSSSGREHAFSFKLRP